MISQHQGGPEEIQGQVRGLLIMFADQLTSRTAGVVDELIDHNESGVAIEVLSEALDESGVEIPADALSLLAELVAKLHLDPINVDRLR